VAAVIFIVACAIWVLPEMVGMIGQRARVSRREALVRDRGSLVWLIGLQWVGLILGFLLALRLPEATIGPAQNIVFAVGIAAILLGVSLRWYAIFTLGSYFTRDIAVGSDQPVVRSGPYALVRHPAYSGTFLTMLGIGLALTNWAGLAILLAGVFVGHLPRVLLEEEALRDTIGQPYVDYMRETSRFIPRVF
jgi:protein-S-isoprenylcysteine O-methyltransferase Ste14